VPFCLGAGVLPYNYTVVPNPTMEVLAPRAGAGANGDLLVHQRLHHENNNKDVSPSSPAGSSSVHRYHDTFPYFQMVAQSNCNPRISQFLCSLLEPECGPRTPVKPPCRKFCRCEA
jgi:hypothetical protein